MKEWNDKLLYKADAIQKMQSDLEEKKPEENHDRADTVSIVSTAGYHKLEPSPSSYVIAIEGKPN